MAQFPSLHMLVSLFTFSTNFLSLTILFTFLINQHMFQNAPYHEKIPVLLPQKNYAIYLIITQLIA